MGRFLTEQQALNLLTPEAKVKIDSIAFNSQKRNLLQYLKDDESLEDLLATDISLVLLSDMLVKVDLMSMANSLEVRSPFLDHEVVDFAFSLPTCYKIDEEHEEEDCAGYFQEILAGRTIQSSKARIRDPFIGLVQKRTSFNDNRRPFR